MAKEAFYFTHDYGSRNDPKLQKVMMKLGHEGKSVYWDLVEMLYEEGGYLLLAECDNYAFALRTQCDFIQKLVNDFDLFKKNDTNFWSESILRRLDKRDEKSKKASQSAKTRWDKANALKNDANALRPECEGNAIKERKVNEKKRKDFVVASLSVQQSKDVYNSVKDSFLKEYLEKYATKYYFVAKDGTKIQEIIKKVYFKMKENNEIDGFTVEDISTNTNLFLKATFKIADNWLTSNFNLSNIDSKFNDIYTQLKSKASGKQITGSKPKSKYSTV